MIAGLRGIASFLLLMGVAAGQDAGSALELARNQQPAGDNAKGRATLFQAVKQFPQDLSLARAQARLLDATGDPGRRAAYKHVVELAKQQGQEDRAAERRLALLNLAAGDRAGIASLGAAGVNLAAYEPYRVEVVGAPTIHLPRPVPSFRRMAPLSSHTPDSELLAAP